MNVQETSSANRLHIGFFGKRNAGKSSLVNSVTNQNLSVVSDVLGTTTDPVRKTMELLPIGPVVIIDTPGFDDEGDLGELRIKKTKEVMNEIDFAVLVIDCTEGMSPYEENFIRLCKARKIPYMIAYNKSDLLDSKDSLKENEIYVSATAGFQVKELKDLLGKLATPKEHEKTLIADFLHPGDTVFLVIPVDEGAPKSRIIMPQQMVLRDVLDANACAIACQPEELPHMLETVKGRPAMVITDSQAFGRVAKMVPEEIPLTSFSIIMARYKGELDKLIKGSEVLDHLQDGDRVLIAESCTHHRQCNDIGTVKMPTWIRQFSGAEPDFDFTSGREFPEDVSSYKLVIHCGGCMINETAMKSRMKIAQTCHVPILNYGVAIAKMNGILARSLELFL